MAIDYSFYLVTDSGMLPEHTTVLSQVEAALENGVTIIQLREKTADTREFVALARAVHALTKPRGVPLIINDRVDVALAVDAEGVHVGQDDMPAAQVRALIGPSKIVGVSVHDEHELKGVLALNLPGHPKIVDYIGIGAVYGTKTKDLKEKHPIGVYGLKRILELNNAQVETVAIGGINPTNVQKVFYGSRVSDSVKLDGVAVVSCIMASKDAAAASRILSQLIKAMPPWVHPQQQLTRNTAPALSAASIEQAIRELAPQLFRAVTQRAPLVHHITNNVVKNFSANVTLATGASPVMSECAGEFAEFSQISAHAALLINTGMPFSHDPEDGGADIYLAATEEYNKRGLPITLDPVGVGASKLRQGLTKTLLESAFFNVVKGNEGEIFTLHREVSGLVTDEGAVEVSTKGVDSVGAAALRTSLRIGRALARHYQTTLLMTGAEDVVSDQSGAWNVAVRNGHEYMARITGSGCSLGSVVSACLAMVKDLDPTSAATAVDPNFLAAITAVLVYTIAGERAAARPEVRGPGTFLPAFVDEIYLIAEETRKDDFSWIKNAKFRVFGTTELDSLNSQP
jgi:thiamine-phosphate diphosphorylase/hydroxyethylthiazole kinase